MKFKPRHSLQKINNFLKFLEDFANKNDYNLTITKNNKTMSTTIKNKNNTAVLFKNDNKTNDNQPDYKGKIHINDTEKKLSAWIKTSQDGKKYLSIVINEPNEAKEVKPKIEIKTEDEFLF